MHSPERGTAVPAPSIAPPHAARRRQLRLGFAAASVSTFVALASHLAAGGDVPGPLGVLFPLLVATAVSIRLAAIRRSTLRLAASVCVSQFVFHALFVLGVPTGATAGGSTAGHAAHHVDPAPAMAAFEPTAAHVHTSPAMWLLHAAAAIATTAALRHGEALIASLAALRAFVGGLLALPAFDGVALPVEPAQRPRAAHLPWVPALRERVVRCLAQRGPPALAVASPVTAAAR